MTEVVHTGRTCRNCRQAELLDIDSRCRACAIVFRVSLYEQSFGRKKALKGLLKECTVWLASIHWAATN